MKGWPDPDANGPQPVIWSPAASGWAAIVNEEVGRTLAGPSLHAQPVGHRHAPPDGRSPRLSGQSRSAGRTSLALATHRVAGPPPATRSGGRSGSARPTRTSRRPRPQRPQVAQAYAATGKTSGLSPEDLARPEVQAFARGVESAVVHYGDTTLDLPEQPGYRADRRGTAFSYASAVAVEEQSGHQLQPGQPRRHPRPRRAAPAPEGAAGGHLPQGRDAVLRPPLLRAGCRLGQRGAACRSTTLDRRTSCSAPRSQQEVIAFGLRPANPQVPKAAPLVASRRGGPRRSPPTELRGARRPGLVVAADGVGAAAQGGPGAAGHRRLRLDGGPGGPGRRRHEAGVGAVGRRQRRPGSVQGQRPGGPARLHHGHRRRSWAETSIDLVPVGPADEGQRSSAPRADPRACSHRTGTPLYHGHARRLRRRSSATATTPVAHQRRRAADRRPSTMTAIPPTTADQLDEPCRPCEAAREPTRRRCGSSRSPTGTTPTRPTLRRIAEASNGAAATSPPTRATINDVFTTVVSNF